MTWRSVAGYPRGQAHGFEDLRSLWMAIRVLRHDDGEKALLTGTLGLRAWHSQASYRNLWVKTGKEMETLAFRQAERVPQVSGMWRACASWLRGGRIRHCEDSTVHGNAVAAWSLRFRRRASWGLRTRASIAGA